MKIAVGTLAAVLLASAPLRGQVITPSDQRDSVRFAAAVRVAGAAGYAHPMVVGRSDDTIRPLIALLAGRADTTVLIVADPNGRAPARPIELEHESTPAQLGVRGIQFTAFLGRNDLVDVIVNHEPLTLEMSLQFETHNVLRRAGVTPTLACQFRGNSASSASKGIGSTSGKRHVGIERVGTSPPLRFRLAITDSTTTRSGRQAAVNTGTASTKLYELPPSGICRELP